MDKKWRLSWPVSVACARQRCRATPRQTGATNRLKRSHPNGGHGGQVVLHRRSSRERARRHLWMHFTRLGADPHAPLPIIVSGEGCYVYDADGKRYLDGLSALYCVNVGHGRAELARGRGDAAARARLLHELELRAPARDRARRRASPSSRPGDLNRVFFTSGGSEAVESALKLARAYHRLHGKRAEDKIDRARDRLPRHDARRALGDRHHRGARAVRAARARAAATSRTRTPTAGRRDAIRCGRRRRSPSGSSSRGPRPSPP